MYLAFIIKNLIILKNWKKIKKGNSYVSGENSIPASSKHSIISSILSSRSDITDSSTFLVSSSVTSPLLNTTQACSIVAVGVNPTTKNCSSSVAFNISVKHYSQVIGGSGSGIVSLTTTTVLLLLFLHTNKSVSESDCPSLL